MLALLLLPLVALPTRVDAQSGQGSGDVLRHLRALQDIAVANGGNRASGEPGYDRSVDYVADRLREAGYDVRVEPFEFPTFKQLSPPRLASRSGEEREVPAGDLRTLAYSAGGEVTGQLLAVDLGLSEAEPARPSTSGCEASDFSHFTAGAIALVRRGTCPFQTKVENATASGASAVVIMNEGGEGRRGAFGGRLTGPASIPAVAVSHAQGVILSQLAEDQGTVRLEVNAETVMRTTRNVIAERDVGQADRIIVVGAHLDSVAAGPGINDNGSGTAAVLETALRLSQEPPREGVGVRFAFWAAEELGLLGSRHHVRALPEDERRRIELYVNLDMVGSRNFGRFVYGRQSEENAEAAADARTALLGWFRDRALPVVEGREENRRQRYSSDDGAFAEAGIPSVSLHTGAGERKSAEHARIFGGEAESPYDACYHQDCDTLDNVSRLALEEMTDALTFALRRLAFASVPADSSVEQSP